jgi:CBS domain-containing protein
VQIDAIMTRRPRTITSSTTVGEAWDVLSTLELRHLPVTNADCELVGVVSDSDFWTRPAPALLTGAPDHRPAPRDALVSTIMTGVPISVEPDDSVDDVVDLMIETKTGALTVLGPYDNVVGVVSYIDILRSLREGAGASTTREF